MTASFAAVVVAVSGSLSTRCNGAIHVATSAV